MLMGLFLLFVIIYHNSRHINIAKFTTKCTADLQKHKFTNFYQTELLWWELNNMECDECLTDMKREGADIERVSVQEHDTDSTVW